MLFGVAGSGSPLSPLSPSSPSSLGGREVVGNLFPLRPPQVLPMFVQCSAEGGPNSLICYIKPIKKINDISWFIAQAFAFRDGVKNEEEKRHFLFKLRYSKQAQKLVKVDALDLSL